MSAETNDAPKDLIGFLDFYLVQKAPFQLPDEAKEWLVKYGPWITVVLLVLTLPLLLFMLGLGTALVPFGGIGIGYASGFTYLTIVLIGRLGLTLAALPGLFARKMSGWRLLFYGQILSLVFALLSGSIVGGILGGLISMYILFQVRPLYKA